jgi:type II secretory pathway component GspD/PulD (secretin)
MTQRLAVLALLCSALSFGQEREIPFANAGSAEELPVVLRMVAGVTVDALAPGAQKLTVRGTPEQLAVAEWLVGAAEKGSADEFRGTGGSDVVRVFPVAHATERRQFAELGTVIRSVFEIRQLAMFTAMKSMVVRGTAEQVAGSEWLLRRLDGPASTVGNKRDDHEELQLLTSADPDKVVAIFHLANITSQEGLQKATTSIRSTTQARRCFLYAPTRTIVIRGTREQLATATSLVAELDVPRSATAQ